MKKLGVLGMALICALFFVACSGSDTTADFKDVQLSAEIDESTCEPITVTSEFYTDTPEIYVTGIVDNAPEGTLIGAEWLYVEDGEELFIDGADLETDEVKLPFYFSLEKPNDDWPIGEYKVNLYIDKEVVSTLSFNVIEYSEESKTAVLKDLQVASVVDEENYEPITITNTFSTDSPKVYVTGVIDNITPGQSLRTEWFYVGGGKDTLLGPVTIELGYKLTYFYFYWPKPTDGWSVGKYKVDIYLDDIYMDSAFFEVE